MVTVVTCDTIDGNRKKTRRCECRGRCESAAVFSLSSVLLVSVSVRAVQITGCTNNLACWLTTNKPDFHLGPLHGAKALVSGIEKKIFFVLVLEMYLPFIAVAILAQRMCKMRKCPERQEVRNPVANIRRYSLYQCTVITLRLGKEP